MGKVQLGTQARGEDGRHYSIYAETSLWSLSVQYTVDESQFTYNATIWIHVKPDVVEPLCGCNLEEMPRARP